MLRKNVVVISLACIVFTAAANYLRGSKFAKKSVAVPADLAIGNWTEAAIASDGLGGYFDDVDGNGEWSPGFFAITSPSRGVYVDLGMCLSGSGVTPSETPTVFYGGPDGDGQISFLGFLVAMPSPGESLAVEPDLWFYDDDGFRWKLAFPASSTVTGHDTDGDGVTDELEYVIPAGRVLSDGTVVDATRVSREVVVGMRGKKPVTDTVVEGYYSVPSTFVLSIY